MLPLLSLRLLAVLGVLLVVAVLVTVRARRVAPGHTGALRAAAASLSFLLVVALTGAMVNRHFGLYRNWIDLTGTHSRDLVSVHGAAGLQTALSPLPPTSPSPGHGTLFEIDVPGPQSGVKPRATYVYLPPQYREPLYQDTRFPVVEAFQGSPGRPSDWIQGLRLDQVMDQAIRKGLVAPSIVVMPDTNGGLARSLECANTADGKNDEIFLVSDVRSWVESTLRVRAGRWAALGYSTGGYCALDLSLRHPDMYYSAVSIDGYAHALRDHYARGIWHSRQDQLEHSPDWWVANHPPELVDLYLLAGMADPASVREAAAFWDEVGRLGWARRRNAFVVQPGGTHTFPSWEAALGRALQWAVPGPSAPTFREAAPDLGRILSQLPPPPTASATPAPRPSRSCAATRPPTASPSRVPPTGPAGPTPRPDPSARPDAAPAPDRSPEPARSPGCGPPGPGASPNRSATRAPAPTPTRAPG